MKHELGESYVWQGSDASKYETTICLCIPPITNPQIQPEKCHWVGTRDSYYWGAMNNEFYDHWTYCIALPPEVYFKDINTAMSKAMRSIDKPVLIRPKDLYETNNPPAPRAKKVESTPKPGVTGRKTIKKG